MKNIFVPIIKMRSALLDDDVDTGAGGDGSLHFYPPLPLNHLATFVRSELCNPAKHFSATFSQTRAPFNSSSVKSGIRGEEQPIYAINFSVQQMQWGI